MLLIVFVHEKLKLDVKNVQAVAQGTGILGLMVCETNWLFFMSVYWMCVTRCRVTKVEWLFALIFTTRRYASLIPIWLLILKKLRDEIK